MDFQVGTSRKGFTQDQGQSISGAYLEDISKTNHIRQSLLEKQVDFPCSKDCAIIK